MEEIEAKHRLNEDFKRRLENIGMKNIDNIEEIKGETIKDNENDNILEEVKKLIKKF